MKRLVQRHPILIFTFLTLLCHTGQAQFDNWINKPHAARYQQIRTYITLNVLGTDTASAFQSIARLKTVAEKAGDDDLILEADYIHALLTAEILSIPRRKVLMEISRLISKAEKEDNLQIQIRARILLRHYYWYVTKNYEKGFEEYFKIYPLLQKTTGKEFPEKSVTLAQMGEAYYFFADYKNAINYSRQALNAEVIFEHRGVHNTAMNTIGLSYVKEGMLDSADYYFNKILHNVGIGDYDVWKGIAQGDLGQTAYLRGDYEKAIPLLLGNTHQAVIISDFDQAARSMTLLSDIYFRQNRLPDSESAMKKAREFVQRSRILKPLEQLFQVYGKVYAAQGNIALTNVYLDSANKMRDTFAKEFNSIQMLRATERSKLQEHRADMEHMWAERQIKTLERNILLILIVLLIFVALYFYKTYYYKAREKERIVNDQLKRAEQELAFAGIQLEEFTRSISEKNQLVEELSTRYGISPNDDAVQELQRITILTDDQWEYFRGLFEKIHKGYLSRLKEKLPGLTPAEIRFMALAKLNLSYKEMASTLGISVQSVRVIRHRLRKKLNLPEEADLKDVVGSI
ncbi:tetratricopeptide repeat protein [Dyadobacter arcticus]|uniref:DNA-binding CsgD family transcriptional regulator n=1 Tax=Dyadobacter arcticus TaxID=1078754 RepID=A0ABX0UMC2_9BACT|nr:hypothetical protein [Dyadobacter arcticus]NIJ54154.1 DNA-binding CsgD family transcriptional regulator [Dyadobacter arcticus]